MLIECVNAYPDEHWIINEVVDSLGFITVTNVTLCANYSSIKIIFKVIIDREIVLNFLTAL